MGSLLNQRIDLTFDGLLKTDNNTPFDGTYQTITDGLGNKSGLQILNNGAGNYGTVLSSDDLFTNGLAVDFSGISFGGSVDFQTSTVDFTNSTVVGLPTGSNTTYTLSGVENNPDGIIRLTGSDATTNDVSLLAGTNVNMTTVGNQITINATDTNTNTTYVVESTQSGPNVEMNLNGSDLSQTTINLLAGTNVTLTDDGLNNVTIDAAGGGSAVSSLNLLDGDLNLVAGTGVTITDDGLTNITIAASGGGGTSKSTVITSGVVNTWPGPAGQDVLVMSTLIPANTITGAATIEFRSPVVDGPEGQFNYSSFQIAPTPGDFGFINLLGRQASGGGPDSYFWYRSITVAADGTAYYIDTNGYQFPNATGDPVTEMPMNWAIDQYFSLQVWCDAANATWKAYSPSLTITNV
tara:strand:+ start:1375 stop:2598 length:1224 start_codon:yes stop_codon:yes gene_type:complete